MKALIIIRMETEHHTFLAIGVTEADAKRALLEQWKAKPRGIDFNPGDYMTLKELRERYGFCIATFANPYVFGAQCEEY